MNEQLLQASLDQDGNRIQELSIELAELQKSNDQMFEDLEVQMDAFDTIEARYNDQLEAIERESF
mgnify:FL=1